MPRWPSSCLFVLFLAFVAVPTLSHAPVSPGRFRSSPSLGMTEPGGWKSIHEGIEFRKITLERAEPHQVIDLKLVRFDPRAIAPRIVASAQYNLRGMNVKMLADKSGAVAMINASYFDENGKPLGFLKIGGGEVNPRVSRSSLFTGIFGIKDLLPFIVHRDEFLSPQADEGLQAGPLLVANGKALPVRRGAGRQSRRSLIGLDREQRLIVAVTDGLFGGLTWTELQEIFSAPQWQLQATNLLNLDGGGSAQLYVRGDQLEELVPGTTEVPVAIGFFKR